MPQAFTRLGSVSLAFPGWSDTRFVWVTPWTGIAWWECWYGAAMAGPVATIAAEVMAAAARTTPGRRFANIVLFLLRVAGQVFAG
jgi:hypothetical protein